MSTTLNVTSISDLSVFSRPKAGGGANEKEWVLRVQWINAASRVEVSFFELSGNYLLLTSAGRNSSNLLQLTFLLLPAEPVSTPTPSVTNAAMTPYQFGGDTTTTQPYIIVEDITMGLDGGTPPTPGPNIYDLKTESVVMNVEETSNPDEYQHRVWRI